jgi:hypothetical protein
VLGCGRIAVFGDYLYMTVRQTDLVFAQVVDGCTAAAVPRGAAGIANPDYSPGFRLGAGFALTPCNSIRASYMWWDSGTTSSIAAPDGLFIRSQLAFPATQNCAADSGAASVRYDHDLRIADLEFKSIVAQRCNSHIGAIVGVRYAHLEQDLVSDFSILGDTNVTTGITFDGIGPRLGVEGEVYGRGGLFGYGRGLVSFLVGSFSADFTQSNNFVGVQAQTTYDNDRIVPMLDLELGDGWMSQGGCVVVRVGYMYQAWFNTVTTPSLINAIGANNFTTNGDNLQDCLTFDGLTARVEFRF